jgi:hypothetical protein
VAAHQRHRGLSAGEKRMLAKGASHTALGRLTRFVSPVRWHHYHRLMAQGFRLQRHAQSAM